MSKLKPILSAFLLLLLVNGIGQTNSVIDSLENVLKIDLEDTAKVNCMNELSNEYIWVRDYKMAMDYAQSAFELAKTQDYKIGIADSYILFNWIFVSQGECPEALENAFAALKISKEIGYKKGIANAYLSIGDTYGHQNKYPEALENLFTSLKISKEIGNKTVLADVYLNIGLVYEAQAMYPEALENYFASLKFSEEIGYEQMMAWAYLLIGDEYERQNRYPEALENYFTALKISKEIGLRRVIAYAYHSIGWIYQLQAMYPEALENYFAYLKISEEIFGLCAEEKCRDGDRRTIACAYLDIGIVYKEQGNYQEALKNLFIAEKKYEELGDKEGIATRNNRRRAELELALTDKALKEQKLEKQKLIRNGMIAGVVLIVLVGLLLFRSFRLRKKLDKQRAIIQERHRISADLHDDVGSGLSKITLLSELLKTQSKTPKLRKEAEKISETALELSSTISEIIWALNSNNDYLDNMIAYIRRYAAEYFENSPVKLKIVTQGTFLPTPINEEHRRNIFYTVKEALNNILKHAEATEAELKFVVVNDKLSVIISDNGKGIQDKDMNHLGNGIKNMRERMRSINGDFIIESHHGTRIMLKSAI